jgi:hypothetical protein
MLKKSTLFFGLASLFVAAVSTTLATDYILYVRPRSKLGSELAAYWEVVKSDPTISHFAITYYPPHCSLTSFFPKKQTKKEYVQAVEDAIKNLGPAPRTITINGLIQGKQTQKLDYIKLSSSYLLAVTKAFMKNASVPQSYLKNPSTFSYHITLRDHIFQTEVKKKMNKIHSLQKMINLKAKASWSLFLYEKDEDGTLSKIEEFPL